MTLLRQLVIVIVTLFSLLFAGSVVINVNNTRNYLNNQLRTISQDMATSLGLSLSPHIAAGELTTAESMVNAVSDSGYYREVIVSDINGKKLIERVQATSIEGIPQWFIDLIPLETPVGEALIMAGWVQAGTVRISANPGYAYSTLWNNSIDAFWWFLGSSAFVFGLGIIALHYVLRPLRDVETQAKAICDREYPVQGQLPWTLELRSVVSAMNRMTTKVKEMFDEQAAAMDRIRNEAFVDALTGLANRRYFDQQLRHLISSPDSFETGAVLFVELFEFKRFNDRKGYQAGDALIKASGALIGGIAKSIEGRDCFAARLAGPSFALVVGDIVEAEAVELGQRISQGLGELHAQGLTDEAGVGHIGIALYHGQPVGQLLSSVDLALRAAQIKGPNALELHATKTSDEFGTLSATQWATMLQDAIANRRIMLHRQTALATANDTPLHAEILLRIFREDGVLIPAGILIPMASRLHLIQDLDRLVVEEALARLSKPENASTVIAINLFPLSIQDGGFLAWLAAKLRENAALAPRLSFEITEQGAMGKLDALRGWIDQVKACGARTGLDQFGKGFNSFDYLATLKVDYVKIDGSYSREIQNNKDNQLFVDSLVKIAHGLDIQVIAESVETPEEREVLKNLRVDGVKGYGIGKPEPWV